MAPIAERQLCCVSGWWAVQLEAFAHLAAEIITRLFRHRIASNVATPEALCPDHERR
jgi:hypothetical protein